MYHKSVHSLYFNCILTVMAVSCTEKVDAITLLRYFTASFGELHMQQVGVWLFLYFIYIIIYIKLIIYIIERLT